MSARCRAVDGGGGGGASGSIVVTNTTGSLAGITASANGANGTNADLRSGSSGSPLGPGGGGGGGIVLQSGGATTSVTPGTNGTTDGPIAYGSSPGATGIAQTVSPGGVPGAASAAECLTTAAESLFVGPVNQAFATGSNCTTAAIATGSYDSGVNVSNNDDFTALVIVDGGNTSDINATHDELYAGGYVVETKSQAITCPGQTSPAGTCPGGTIAYSIDYRNIAVPSSGTEPTSAVLNAVGLSIS